MQNTTNNKSIKHTLNVIKQALEDKEESQKDPVLILNQLIKEDGTIDIIEDQNIQKEDIKEILENKLSEVFDKKFEKWLDKNLPYYLEKHFLKKK